MSWEFNTFSVACLSSNIFIIQALSNNNSVPESWKIDGILIHGFQLNNRVMIIETELMLQAIYIDYWENEH